MGIHPVGVDLNETNALVAVDPDGNTLFVSGKAVKVANKRNYKTRKRVQQKHATHKAEHRDTQTVSAACSNGWVANVAHRTRTFAQTAAKQLVTWAPANAVLVFEALTDSSTTQGTDGRHRRQGDTPSLVGLATST